MQAFRQILHMDVLWWANNKICSLKESSKSACDNNNKKLSELCSHK